MVRNVWSVLCRDVLVDQESNSVSCIRCLEEGATAALPVRIGPIYLATLWEKEGDEPEAVTARVTLESPGGEQRVLLQTNPLTFARPLQRLQFRIAELSINEFGRFRVHLECRQGEEWNRAASLPLLVRFQAQPTDRQKQPTG